MDQLSKAAVATRAAGIGVGLSGIGSAEPYLFVQRTGEEFSPAFQSGFPRWSLDHIVPYSLRISPEACSGLVLASEVSQAWLSVTPMTIRLPS
jgi:hypothetical protein